MKKIFFILGLTFISSTGIAAKAVKPKAMPSNTAQQDAKASMPTETAAIDGPKSAADTPLSPEGTTIKEPEVSTDDDTFKEILTAAYTNSPVIGSGEYQAKAANEDIMAAKAGWGPSLSVGAGYDFKFDHSVYGDGIPPGVGTSALPNGYREYTHQGDATAQAQLKQNIYAGGATVANIAIAENHALGAQANYIRGQQGTLLKAIKAMLDWVQSKALHELYMSNLSILEKQLDIVKAQFEFGERHIGDVALTEADVDKARADLKDAIARVEIAKTNYRKEIGKDPLDKLFVPNLPTFLPASQEEALQQTLKSNPFLKQIDAEVAAAKSKVDLSYSELKPKVDLTASAQRKLNYAWNENSTRHYGRDRHSTFFAGASVSLPLDVMGANQSKIRKSKYENASQRINSIYQRQDLMTKTTEAWVKYDALKSQLNELQQQVKARKVVVDTHTEAYIAGAGETFRLLEEKRRYFGALVELTRTKYEYLFNAFAVAASVGILTPENLGIKVRTFDNQEHYDSLSRWGLDVKHDQTEYGGETLADLA